MHTGHSVYATLHADNASQAKHRLTNPPISIPEEVLGALHMVIVQYRQRRIGVRRTFEIAEVIPDENKANMSILYSWDPREDKLLKVGESTRLFGELAMHTGFSSKEIAEDLRNKQMILKHLIKQGVRNVNSVGRVVASYYREPEKVLGLCEKGASRKELSEHIPGLAACL